MRQRRVSLGDPVAFENMGDQMRGMKRTRRAAAAVLGVAALLSMAACGGSSSGSQGGTVGGGGKGAPSVGVSEINLSLPFFVQMKDASDTVGKAYGVSVTWQSADGSLEKQISTIENYISQKKNVIMIDPINADALVPVVNKATKAGIKVITMGNKVAGSANVSTLYPDHDNWVKNARILGHAVGGKGTVLLLIGSVGNYVSDTRQKAFEDTMAKEFPNVKVITKPTNFDSSKAAQVTQTVLTDHTNLAGIASISDGLTLPALKVLQSNNKLGMPVVTNDGDPAVYPYIEKGQVISDVLTGSYRVGGWNTAVAARLAKGSTLGRDVFMPTYFVAGNEPAVKAAGVKSITTTEAKAVAQNYLKEFGPAKSNADMTVGK